jgi:hypothetical protein
METNDRARNETPGDIIELGIASVETKGVMPGSNEGIGRKTDVGITE